MARPMVNTSKHQKTDNYVFKYDLKNLGCSLEDFIIILYATLVHMNDLRRCL